VDASLREAGVDPDDAAARAKAAIEAALAKAEPAKKEDAAPAKVVPLDAARARRSRWTMWGVAAAAAAAAVILVKMNTGDDHVVSRPAPSPAELRADAFAACDRKDYAACERTLDEAKQDDPAGEDDARVKDARAAIARWRESHPPEAPKPSHM
jgi:hypothetical protein